MKLRIARATNKLQQISKMYCQGLGFEVLGSFQNHDGFDGVMLGSSLLEYHFEFTAQVGFIAPRSNSAETLIVFFLPEESQFLKTEKQMKEAGFIKVKAHNPYWDLNGVSFEDLEGYRVVLCKNKWK